MDEPLSRILDATCGRREFWKDKSPKHLVCIDRRASVRPDIVADDRYLPFQDIVFDAIYFDPPHNHGSGGHYRDRYGGFGSYDDLRRLFRYGTLEFSRTLKTNGLLITKLTRCRLGHGLLGHPCLLEEQVHRRFAEYAHLAGFTLIFTHQRPSRGMSRQAKVVWMTFRKFQRQFIES